LSNIFEMAFFVPCKKKDNNRKQEQTKEKREDSKKKKFSLNSIIWIWIAENIIVKQRRVHFFYKKEKYI